MLKILNLLYNSVFINFKPQIDFENYLNNVPVTLLFF